MNSHGTYNTSTNTIDLPILKDILSAMYDPELVSAVEEQIDDEHGATMESNLHWKEELSCKPWVYHMDPELQWKLKSVTKSDSHHELMQNNTQCSTCTTNSMMHQPFSAHDESVAFYPTWTFLDLRQVQNHKFAQDRFMQGINYAREKQYDKAESCYKEVLNLMPFHADCLVAYGALCASSTSNIRKKDGSTTTTKVVVAVDDDNDDRLSKAEAMLQRAMEIDPQCSNAQNYLDQIAVARQMRKKQQLTSNVQLLPQKALNDAITERAILYGDKDELASSLGVTDEQRWSEQKKRRHEKKRKKKKKMKHQQRKRQDSDLSSSHHSSSNLSSYSPSNLSYPSHKEKRKRKHSSRKKKNDCINTT